MNFRTHRRHFLTTCAQAGTVALPALFWTRSGLAAAPAPVISIARYKTSPSDPAGIAEEADRLARKALEALGGMRRFVAKGDVVWVKPNMGWNRKPELAATTNPDLVASVVKQCYEAGAGQVFVSDNSCHPAQTVFARSGIQVAAEKAGAKVVFLDPRKCRKMAIKGKALPEWEIYTDFVEADKFINLPIVKHHSMCRATLGMKNLMGAAGGQRNRYHQDLDNTVTDLAVFLKPDLVVLDGIRVLTANGPTGGNLADVARKDIVVAGTDQVAVDARGAEVLGVDPRRIGHIVEAAARRLGTIDYKSLGPKEVVI